MGVKNRIDYIASHNKGTTLINGVKRARTNTIIQAEMAVIGIISYYLYHNLEILKKVWQGQ